MWADKPTLNIVAKFISSRISKDTIYGLCHDTRSGFEQNYLSDNYSNLDVIGTDISDSASNYPRSEVWDFHDVNGDWINRFDFVYSNSLDQSWKPKMALTTWLNQIHKNGVVIIEHTEDHGPIDANEMDPFGVRPTVFPYVLSDWFGHKICVSFKKCKKPKHGQDAWLFIISKNVESITS